MKSGNRTLWLWCGVAALAFHAGAAALLFRGVSPDTTSVGQTGVLVDLSFEGAASGGLAYTGNIAEVTETLAPVQERPQKTHAPKSKTPKVASYVHKKKAVKPQPKPVQAVENISESKQSAPDAFSETPDNTGEMSNALEGVEAGADTPAVTSSKGGAGGKNNSAMGVVGEGNAAQSGGQGGVIKTYEDLIQLWVHKHLIYPQSARERRMTGTVTVRFILSRDGKLLESAIIEACDYGILNRAAIRTIKKAVPFPAFPDDIPEASRSFVIPIEYMAD